MLNKVELSGALCLVASAGLISVMAILSLAWPRSGARRIYTFKELTELINAGDQSVLEQDVWISGRTVYYSYPADSGVKYAWAFWFKLPGSKKELGVPLLMAPDPPAIVLLRRLPIAPFLPSQQRPSALFNAVGLYRVRVKVYNSKGLSQKAIRFELQNALPSQPFPPDYVMSSNHSVDQADTE